MKRVIRTPHVSDNQLLPDAADDAGRCGSVSQAGVYGIRQLERRSFSLLISAAPLISIEVTGALGTKGAPRTFRNARLLRKETVMGELRRAISAQRFSIDSYDANASTTGAPC